MDEAIYKDKEILFFKYKEGNCTSDEEEQVRQLVSNSEQAAEELEWVEDIIALDIKIKAIQAYDVDKGYRQFEGKIKKHFRMNTSSTLLLRSVAVLAILLFISTLALLYSTWQQKHELDHIAMVQIISAPGLVSYFDLPDGSQVWLNSGSTLTYPSVFRGGKREVRLDGEGYFKVKADKEHPFYVQTENGIRVMAYGTRFNINAYREHNNIETLLEEGKVDVSVPDVPAYRLLPGECAILNKANGQISVSRVNIYEKTAWKDGKIVFRNATLDDVFKQLERRYNVDIVLHDAKNMSKNYRCRVTFTHETIQQIFSYLEVAAPIKWKLSEPARQEDATLFRQRIDVWLNSK